MSAASAKERAAGLAIWRGPVDPQPLGGGMTNFNFLVEDGGERFVVRVVRARLVKHHNITPRQVVLMFPEGLSHNSL